MFNSRNSQTDRERYLERELEEERDRAREAEDRQYRAEEQRRKQRQEEMREQYEFSMRSANDWPEALQKQAALCWREHNLYPEQDDVFFKILAEANEKALEIWNEVSASRQSEFEELQKRMDAIWDSVRGEVADKLIASSDRAEYKQVAQAIRDDSIDGYLNW